jgi:hypothetical protein
MKPVYQTSFGVDGNCLQACVASILEVSLDKVPCFTQTGQFLQLDRFMRTYGLCVVALEANKVVIPYDAYYLMWGTTPRGFKHSVVGLNGKVAHDPFPNAADLVSVEQYVLFVGFATPDAPVGGPRRKE